MTLSLSFSLLLPYVVVLEGRGLYIDVPSKEIHFIVFFPICLVQEAGLCSHFIVGYFFLYQYPVMHNGSMNDIV